MTVQDSDKRSFLLGLIGSHIGASKSPVLHEMSADAIAIGAANTVVLRDGKRIGHNTDWYGFAAGVRRGLPGAAVGRVAQAGAGGAGAATAFAMLTLGCKELLIFGINMQRSRDLATPVGMVGHPGTPFDSAMLRSHMWVSDVIYAPLETEMLAHARQLGSRTMNGGAMLSFQAARAFQLFTGIEANAERMLATFLRTTGNNAVDRLK